MLNDLEFFGLLVFLEVFSKTRGSKLCRRNFQILLNVCLLGFECLYGPFRTDRAWRGQGLLEGVDLPLQGLDHWVAVRVKRTFLNQLRFQLGELRCGL